MRAIGKLFCSFILSRKLWMAAICLQVVYGVYWQSISVLYTLKDPEQLHAFTQLTLSYYATVGAILLGYLGFNTLAGRTTGTPLDRIFNRASVPAPAKPQDRSWKSDPNQR